MTNCMNPGSRNNRLSKMWLGTFLFLAMAALISLPRSMDGQDRKAGANSSAGAKTAADAGAGGDLARGKYLVEDVTMCGQCHTPRDMNGKLDRSHWLEGAAVPWVPAQSRVDWPLMAPRIGGTPPASDADMVKLLTTGIWTNGEPLHFPMMPFRLSEADARAVVAYLKTPSAWK
ncbi:MAG: c-type cytochrome [Terriglobales bacterium]